MIYFTSDTHFCDDSQLWERHRPFNSVSEMDSYILGEMKKSLTPNDELWHLGDFSYCRDAEDRTWEKGLALVKNIPAKVNLITGNNEDRLIKFFFNGDYLAFAHYCKELGFAGVYPSYYLNTDSGHYYLSHEPTSEHKPALKLHGHIHRYYGIVGCNCGVNLSTDLYYFKPLSEKELTFIVNAWQLDKVYVDKL